MKTTGDGFEGEKEAGGAAHLREHDGELERTGEGEERRGRRRRKKMLAAGLLTDQRSRRRGRRSWQLRLLIPSAILSRMKARCDSRSRMSLALPMSTAWRSFMHRSWRGSRWGKKERKEGKGESGDARGKRKEAARVGGGGSGCCLYSWGKGEEVAWWSGDGTVARGAPI